MPLTKQEFGYAKKDFFPGANQCQAAADEVLIGQGQAVAQAVRVASISEQGYYRWRKEYDGLRLEQANASRTWRETTSASRSWLWSCPWTRQCSKR